MKISQAGLDLIKTFEGLRLDAYLCPANVWTIGYGHTLGVVSGMTITQDEAERLLRDDDLPRYEAGLAALLKVPVTQGQWDALTSFCFNLGCGALAQSTLLRRLNAGEYSSAAAEFGKWVKAGNTTLPGLVRRRAAERKMFEGA